MHIRRTIFSFISACLMMLMILPSVFANDDRINQVRHFGGDALYCDQERGCWFLNINGELLWEVPQSVIDAAYEVACETESAQYIEAGMGTYGPNVLEVHCPDGEEAYYDLTGYDEWGKINNLRFGASYAPVNAPHSEKAKAEKADPTPTVPPPPPPPPPMTCSNPIYIWPICEPL